MTAATTPPTATPSSRSTPPADAFVAQLADAFARAADPSRAVGMAAYMRDQFAFFGVPTTERVALTRSIAAGLDRPTLADLEAIARKCWARDERELQYAAQWMLRRHVTQLPASFLPVVRDLLTTRSWWDTVDELAQNVVGPIVLAHREELEPVMDRWIDDENIWLARTAILHQNRYRTATDPERLFRYCARRAGDREFFLRKAIGWALREYSKTDANAVRAFVADPPVELSGLSRREALKWLDRREAQAAHATAAVEPGAPPAEEP